MSFKKSSLFATTKSDLLSSVVVFLVALPLCLGIALASGAPLLSGIISGIIGGIVVGLLSKSHLSVSGPAAGLVVIVLNAIDTLGGFEFFLVALVIAGALQILLGFLKAGVVGFYIPSSVIKGMLAAIGLILILGQIQHLIGFDEEAFSDEAQFFGGEHSVLTTFSTAFDHIYEGSLIVGFFCLLILILWSRPFIQSNKVLRTIPGGLIAVVAGIVMNLVFVNFYPALAIGSTHLVNLPAITNMSEGESVFVWPDFSIFGSLNLYVTAVTIAIIASLETLLSIEAVDNMDPLKRKTPQNAELKAQGVANMLCGFVGGLPVTAVIVRSTANLDAGAKSKMSAVYHGVILLLTVALIPSLLNWIPLASLAAILIMVGYKLTKPSLYKYQYKLGMQQFVPFITTVVAIMFTDLLIGILVGMAVSLFYIAGTKGVPYITKANFKRSFNYSEVQDDEGGGTSINIELKEDISFLSKASLQAALEHVPENKNLMVDGSLLKTKLDHDAMQLIQSFKSKAPDKNINIRFKNISEDEPTQINH